MTDRRAFLHRSAAAAAGAIVGGCAHQQRDRRPDDERANHLPRWRGFNLLEMFTTRSKGDFAEDDFRWMRDWGFDFARIPMCYTLWTEGDDVYQIDESMLENVDRVVEYGAQYGIHISLNFHRAPGYSVNRERTEPFNLWQDQDALDAFCFHWALFARRYRGISSDRLSFNLVNEPTAPGRDMTRRDHERVIRAAVDAVREIDSDRLVIVDGLSWGRKPVPELCDLNVAQSTRAYDPMSVTHYQAEWVDEDDWPAPTWPGRYRGKKWDRQALEKHYRPWIELMQRGVGVHCGEGGAYNRTPHDVVLRWLEDVLEILAEAGIGFALWNLRGSFGVLDSGRHDVAYEDWHGHQLDRELLTLLQRYG